MSRNLQIMRTPITPAMLSPDDKGVLDDDMATIQYWLRKVLIRDLQAMANMDEPYSRNPYNLRKIVATYIDIESVTGSNSSNVEDAKGQGMEGIVSKIVEQVEKDMHVDAFKYQKPIKGTK